MNPAHRDIRGLRVPTFAFGRDAEVWLDQLLEQDWTVQEILGSGAGDVVTDPTLLRSIEYLAGTRALEDEKATPCLSCGAVSLAKLLVVHGDRELSLDLLASLEEYHRERKIGTVALPVEAFEDPWFVSGYILSARDAPEGPDVPRAQTFFERGIHRGEGASFPSIFYAATGLMGHALAKYSGAIALYEEARRRATDEAERDLMSRDDLSAQARAIGEQIERARSEIEPSVELDPWGPTAAATRVIPSGGSAVALVSPPDSVSSEPVA